MTENSLLKLIMNKLNCTEEELDMYIAYDILRMCRYGFSVNMIYDALDDIPKYVIINTLERYYRFNGWYESHDMSVITPESLEERIVTKFNEIETILLNKGLLTKDHYESTGIY